MNMEESRTAYPHRFDWLHHDMELYNEYDLNIIQAWEAAKEGKKIERDDGYMLQIKDGMLMHIKDENTIQYPTICDKTIKSKYRIVN